jgi:hypothetical protein
MSIRHLSMRRTWLLVTFLAAIIAVPSTAWAFWTAAAVGTGTALTGTLEAPTDVRADATGGDVVVSWASPTQSYPASTLGYEAKDDRGNTVCSAASPTATSCSYRASAGTFRYAVTAAFESWTATSDLSDPLTVTATPTVVEASAGSGQSAAPSTGDPAASIGDGAVATPDDSTATDPDRAVTADTVAITSAPATGSASSTADLGAITVELQDSSGAPVPAAIPTMVFLSSNSTGTAVFAATRRGPALTSVTIPPGSSSVSFFYGDTEAGTPTVTAEVAGLTPATQIQVVTAAVAQAPTLPTQPPSSPNAG